MKRPKPLTPEQSSFSLIPGIAMDTSLYDRSQDNNNSTRRRVKQPSDRRRRAPGFASLPYPLPLLLAELLETCCNSSAKTTAIGFVDDVNILAYGPSTESSCRKLEETRRKCLDWAGWFGLKFAFQKYN